MAEENVNNDLDTQLDDDYGDESDLIAALQSLKNGDDLPDEEEETETDESTEEQTEEETDDNTNDDNESDEENSDEEESDEQKGQKREQSKEENARFAAERRKREAEERAKAELERLKQEAPEFKLAKQLSELYGRPADQILVELQEAALKKEAEEQKVPIEYLRKQQQSDERVSQLQDEINQLRYQNWETQIKADSAALKNQYKFLSDEDINSAVDYILKTVKNVEVPLEQALFAVHGKKIVEELANAKLQDELADQSGRKKKTPPSPSGGKTPNVVTLTSEEQAVARAFGMSDAEYAQYKSQ